MGRIFITWKNSQENTKERQGKQEQETILTMYYNTKYLSSKKKD